MDTDTNVKAELDPLGDCPQTEVLESWTSRESIYDQMELQSGNEEGYEGDMEGDGGLMPPPSTIP